MISEILAIGDKIRSGALVDSNSAYIAQKLEETGIEIARHSTLGDDPAEIVIILKEISLRSDIAVVTGGLGPADDELTAAAGAAATMVEASPARASGPPLNPDRMGVLLDMTLCIGCRSSDHDRRQCERTTFVRSRAERVDFAAIREHSGYGRLVKLVSEEDSSGRIDRLLAV